MWCLRHQGSQHIVQYVQQFFNILKNNFFINFFYIFLIDNYFNFKKIYIYNKYFPKKNY